MRWAVQLGFLALVGVGVFVVEGNAERWCPFGGAEAIYMYVREGNLPCSLGVSNLFALGGTLLSVLLLRRAFCGYACPIGAISEWTQRAARALGLAPRRVPRRLDAGLSLLKYAVLGVVLWLTWRAGELVFRGFDPCYALLSRHGEDITFWAYVAGGGVLLLSLALTVPFCRWLCPLGALLNPLSRLGLVRVRRRASACAGCGRCARDCPMAIPVDEVEEVTHARCTSCLACLDACPLHERGALAFGPGGRRIARRPRALVVTGLCVLLATSVAGAWLLPLPSYRWSRGTEPARTASVDLHVEGLSCRGRATLLVYFLERDDDLELPGYLRLEAWPGPVDARARVHFDPAQVGADDVEAALVEPLFESPAHGWRTSPFVTRRIEHDR